MAYQTGIVAPMYLLVKDHKGWSEDDGTPPPSRPVCEGNVGVTRHLSEAVSMVLEPLSHAMDGSDVESTGDMLSKWKSSIKAQINPPKLETRTCKRKWKERKHLG